MKSLIVLNFLLVSSIDFMGQEKLSVFPQNI